MIPDLGERQLVMVSNRLPVDRVEQEDGSGAWQPSPGGLVSAVGPVVEELGCMWVGWAGNADETIGPFELGSMRLVPVPLSGKDVELYYEGFANGTLWPLYHDVIAPPEYHREWWERYCEVNRRFAEHVAQVAAPGALVWVHDYQLQLVPEMLREQRPDLVIAFFLHIPFPPTRLFAQLPWRRRIIEGLLGADILGFQREADASAFREAAERIAGYAIHENSVLVPAQEQHGATRPVLAREFPISIDTQTIERLARRHEVRCRAREIREELGNPQTLVLGVDRLDYTKGILHRFKAYEEMLADGELETREITFVQIASPSRERVDAYRALRDEVETTAGRLNGEHGDIGHTPLVYLHRSYSREEMVSFYLAADVMLVTPLRDGMNLVAKEYAACRVDDTGALVLSEFAGAADELQGAVLVNPHDIEGLKAAILRAVHMPAAEQQRRMHAMRETVRQHDVAHWTESFLEAVSQATKMRQQREAAQSADAFAASAPSIPDRVADGIRRLAAHPSLIVAVDFDGTVAPLVSRPQDAKILPAAQRALNSLAEAQGVTVVLLSGRSLTSLAATGLESDAWIVSGSHGAELSEPGKRQRDQGTQSRNRAPSADATPALLEPSEQETQRLERFTTRLNRIFREVAGVYLERKPFGIAVHTRAVADRAHASELLEAAEHLGTDSGLHVRSGKEVREFTLRQSDKGSMLKSIRSSLPDARVLFLGDDATDEDVFVSLGPEDLGVKVGSGESAAHERIEDPSTAAAVLTLLAELRDR